MATTRRFDPEAHLHKQGWKGKGTAFKQGHATRPLPVVRKKNLAGIGKDRDEAIPFWDNIFAATAASILSSTTTSPNPSQGASPAPSAAVSTPAIKEQETLSIAARMGKEVARRGLYSRFFRGTPVPPADDEESWDIGRAEVAEADASVGIVSASSLDPGPSSVITEPSDRKGKAKDSKGKAKEKKETKEEKLARRAARAAKKAEKEAKRLAKEERRARKVKKADSAGNEEPTMKRKRKAEENSEAIISSTPSAAGTEDPGRKKRKEGEKKSSNKG